jgi:hypothetical protein
MLNPSLRGNVGIESQQQQLVAALIAAKQFQELSAARSNVRPPQSLNPALFAATNGLLGPEGLQQRQHLNNLAAMHLSSLNNGGSGAAPPPAALNFLNIMRVRQSYICNNNRG